MTRPLLSIERVSKTYGGAALVGRSHPVKALDDVSLKVAAGTIHGIVGESGSGKSTLARIVMALDRPSAGHVLLDGNDLHSMPPRPLRTLRRDFQMIFQDPYSSLDPRQRIGRIVAEPLHVLSPKLSRTAVTSRVADVLTSVGLSPDDAKRHPHAFSGGQRQRIAIARALATKPKLIVADEAVSALDLSVQAQILNLLMDLRDDFGVTILFIGHDLSVVEAIADTVSVMQRGRIVETGAAAEIFKCPTHAYTQSLIEAVPSLDGGT